MPPRLPDFTSLGQAPTPQTPLSVARIETQPLEFNVRQGPGEAAIRGGQQITHAGIQMQDRIDTLRAEEATNKLQDVRTQLEVDPQQGFANVKGSAAIDQKFRDEYSRRFESAQKTISDTLGNANQQQMFNNRAAVLRHQYDSSLFTHMSQQTSAFADNTEKATVQVELNNASNAPNDAAFDTSMVRVRGILSARGARLQEPPAETELNKLKALDSAWTERIRVTNESNPLLAQAMYDANKDKIGPDNKIILEHQLHQSVTQVQARNLANSIIGGANADDTIKAVAAGGDEAITGMIQGTKTQTRANLMQWIEDAKRSAEVMRPGDPVFQDMVVAQVRGHVATMVAAQEGLAQAAHAKIMAAALGPDGKNKPLTLDQLLSTPDLRAAWGITSPESQRGFFSMLGQNAREAEGVPIRVNARVVEDAFMRIHLPAEDPNKIISPTQLAPMFAHGLNQHYYDWLKKEIAQQQTDEGRNLTTTRENYLHGVKGQFDKGTIMVIDAKGGEDFNKFRTYVLGKEAKAIQEGKNPYDLYNYKSPAYISNAIPAFQRTLEEQIKGMAESMRAASSPNPSGTVGTFTESGAVVGVMTATNTKTGERLISRDAGVTWIKLSDAPSEATLRAESLQRRPGEPIEDYMNRTTGKPVPWKPSPGKNK
jgi:hypothetical protein